MGLVWIWAYCFLIVWWTYAVSVAYNLNFSILPMIIYPFGIVLRDIKKLDDMRVVLKVFKEQCMNLITTASLDVNKGDESAQACTRTESWPSI